MEQSGIIRIHSFDGQVVWLDANTELYEVGNYLGGGAAGTVYECEQITSHNRYALKILNPLGFKISSSTLLRRCSIVLKGKLFPDIDYSIDLHLTKDHIWWLLNSTTKQYLGCYYSQKYACLKELSLSQCLDLWGKQTSGISCEDDDILENIEIIQDTCNGSLIYIPSVAPKFIDYIKKRKSILREIKNMRKINNHPNVIKLESALELVEGT